MTIGCFSNKPAGFEISKVEDLPCAKKKPRGLRRPVGFSNLDGDQFGGISQRGGYEDPRKGCAMPHSPMRDFFENCSIQFYRFPFPLHFCDPSSEPEAQEQA